MIFAVLKNAQWCPGPGSSPGRLVTWLCGPRAPPAFQNLFSFAFPAAAKRRAGTGEPGYCCLERCAVVSRSRIKSGTAGEREEQRTAGTHCSRRAQSSIGIKTYPRPRGPNVYLLRACSTGFLGDRPSKGSRPGVGSRADLTALSGVRRGWTVHDCAARASGTSRFGPAAAAE